MKNRHVISLFSGAMGLDLGLMQAGLHVAVSQDYDAQCGRTMASNRHPHVLGDIRALIAEDPTCSFLLEKANLNAKDIFLVAGGPPCQSFSTLGKRLGLNDPRGSLFMEFAHVVKTVRPRFFVMENVKGLLSLKIGDNTTAFDVVKSTLESIGYSLIHGILDAVDYGVPQFRERLVIIGSRDHEDIFLPRPTHFKQHQRESHRWNTLQSAIADLENNPGEYANIPENRLRYLKMISMGGNWKQLPLELQKEALGGAFESGGGKTGFYRRLDYRQPSPTLLTSPVQKSSMLCHPSQDRSLSVSEYARIQQFPDDWIIEGSVNGRYRQIGNAVPVGLGKAIGEALLSASEGTSTIHSKRK